MKKFPVLVVLCFVAYGPVAAQNVPVKYVDEFENVNHPQVAYWFIASNMLPQPVYRRAKRSGSTSLSSSHSRYRTQLWLRWMPILPGPAFKECRGTAMCRHLLLRLHSTAFIRTSPLGIRTIRPHTDQFVIHGLTI